MKKILTVPVLMMVLCLGASQAKAGWIITQLTDNTTDDINPDISGTNVVWQHEDDSNFEWEIHSNFAGQLTDNNNDLYPVISGTNVAWARGGSKKDIYTNFAGKLTTSSTHDSWPDISGTNVVWFSQDGDIYNINSNFAGQLNTTTTENYYPAISGTNAVWMGWDGSDYEIYSNYSGQLTYDSLQSWSPDISGTNVVWFGPDGEGDHEIYSNFAGQLTNNSNYDVEPAISGTNVVWHGFDGSDTEIYTNFGGQLTLNSNNDKNPAISGMTVVWEGYDGQDWEIYQATYIPDLSGWVFMPQDAPDFGYSVNDADLVYFYSFDFVQSFNTDTGGWSIHMPTDWVYFDWPFYYELDPGILWFALPPESGLWVYHFSTGQWEVLPLIIP